MSTKVNKEFDFDKVLVMEARTLARLRFVKKFLTRCLIYRIPGISSSFYNAISRARLEVIEALTFLDPEE